ncbi:MAG TPA: hypothetical protein VIF62_34155 [Labilithrix sp.]
MALTLQYSVSTASEGVATMSRFIIVSVLFASVSSLVGCGAHSAKAEPAAPTTTYSAVECSPPPGGDMQFEVQDSTKATTRSNTAATSYRSNIVEKPKSGAVHAAY